MTRVPRRVAAFFAARPHDRLHWVITLIHFGFALSIFLRPYLPYIISSYSRFDDVMPWWLWGFWALCMGVWMAAVRPGTLPAQGAHLFSSFYFFMVAGVFVAASGVTSAYYTYSILALSSVWLFAVDFRAWFPNLAAVRHLIDHPPGWIQRRLR